MYLQVLWRHRFLPLDPAVEQIGALLGRVGSLVLDDLLELLEELKLLDRGVRSVVRLTKK